MRRFLPAFAAIVGFCLATAAPAADTPAPDPIRERYRRPAEIPFPDDNLYSTAKAQLGEMLFFDPLLSGAGVRSCSTCHQPWLSWGDGLPRAVGENQTALPLRAPTLIDVAWIRTLGWDGKFRDLESVAFTPILGAGNMNQSEAKLIAALSAIPGYCDGFAAAFADGEITRRNIELALATFERTIVAGKAPFDRWIEGDEEAIGEAAKRGFTLFNTRPAARTATRGGASPKAAFSTSARRKRPILAAPSSFRNCSTRSRRRPCAMSRAGRPTCTTARWPV